jgi:hypothetical protein
MSHGGATGYVFGIKARVNFLLCLANHFMLATVFMVRRATRNFLLELVQSTELVLHYLFQAVYGAEILSYFFLRGEILSYLFVSKLEYDEPHRQTASHVLCLTTQLG